MKQLENKKVFGGQQQRYQHSAETTHCEMTFSIFLPPQAETGKVPVLYWLSGLTCNDQNFATKAGAQALAAELGIAIVMPDTSPRGDDVADAEPSAWDLGKAAGFYINAAQAPWAPHYRMYDYVVKELPELVEATFPVTQQRAIAGHSMGGHGALMIALRNPQRYASVSAFAPIANPSQCPWGQKAFNAYLGTNQNDWLAYDSVALIQNGAAESAPPLLVDTGDADEFLEPQLGLEALSQACEVNYPKATLRMQAGYDHSYYFIASFINQHLRFHAEHLNQASPTSPTSL